MQDCVPNQRKPPKKLAPPRETPSPPSAEPPTSTASVRGRGGGEAKVETPALACPVPSPSGCKGRAAQHRPQLSGCRRPVRRAPAHRVSQSVPTRCHTRSECEQRICCAYALSHTQLGSCCTQERRQYLGADRARCQPSPRSSRPHRRHAIYCMSAPRHLMARNRSAASCHPDPNCQFHYPRAAAQEPSKEAAAPLPLRLPELAASRVREGSRGMGFEAAGALRECVARRASQTNVGVRVRLRPHACVCECEAKGGSAYACANACVGERMYVRMYAR